MVKKTLRLQRMSQEDYQIVKKERSEIEHIIEKGMPLREALSLFYSKEFQTEFEEKVKSSNVQNKGESLC